MPTAISFPGSNVVIAKNQPPYLPLPARVFGDDMGTLLCCWEFTEEELAELINTRRLWSVHYTFNNAFQPMMLATDMPVYETPAKPQLTLFGHPAEKLNEWTDANVSAGWTQPGWYFWNEDKSQCFGPYDCQMTTEHDMLRYAHDNGVCGGPNHNPPCPFPHITREQPGKLAPDEAPLTEEERLAWQLRSGAMHPKCNQWRRANHPDQPYPRTCEDCGLGPCKYYGGAGAPWRDRADAWEGKSVKTCHVCHESPCICLPTK